MTPPEIQKRSDAITVVELILVIGALGVLVALLLPVMSSALESSKAAKCQGNLRAIGTAIHAFAADHRQQIPMRRDERQPRAMWAEILADGGYLPAVAPGVALQRYCPSGVPNGPYDTRTPRRATHPDYAYGMRRWSPPGQIVTGAGADARLYPLSAITEPSKFFLVTDSYCTAIQAQGYFVDATGSNNFWRVHVRHRNRANTLFADGHVEALDRTFFETLHETEYEYDTRTAFPIWP